MKKNFFVILLFALLLISCSFGSFAEGIVSGLISSEDQVADIPSPTIVINEADPIIPTETQAPIIIEEDTASPSSLTEAADAVIQALHDRDMDVLVNLVHPMKGVRFTPFGYVQKHHLVFLPEELPGIMESDMVYVWGLMDGTGDPIILTFNDYFDRFVYRVNYIEPEEIGMDERVGFGNSINNIHEYYPSSQFIEYHFSGFNPDYGGMDWKSLRLVFIEENGVWWLIGIVNDEWTI